MSAEPELSAAAATTAFLGRHATARDGDGAELLALVGAARQRWPGTSADPERFIARLGELAEHSIDRARTLHSDDLWLSTALVDGDAAALASFEAEILSAVRHALARRSSVAGSELDEVLQALTVDLLVPSPTGKPARIGNYGARGPLLRWVLVAAARALDRGRHRSDRVDELATDEPSLVDAVDLERSLLRGEAKAALHDALVHASAALESSERALIRFSVTDGLTIDEIAALLGIHRATAARRLERARRDLARHARHHLGARLGLPPWEVESLIRIVRSSFRGAVWTVLRSTDDDGS